MRRAIHLLWAAALLSTPVAGTVADEPPAPPRTTIPHPPVISSHQIDRYDAINKLQQELQANPKSLADWTILGELAHEVAVDLPADQAPKYYHLSRDAYEKALALDPDNPGLKAAVKFARDQEANAERFENARDRATRIYLDARRRDLAATRYTPTVRVYSPVTAIQPAAVTAATETVSTDPFGVRQFYPAPIYQPYYMPQERLYTYDEYRDAYYPPSYYTVPNGQPITVQRYIQQYPEATLNPVERQIIERQNIRGTTPVAPAPRRP